jgi:opacity protein-like surface antigen
MKRIFYIIFLIFPFSLLLAQYNGENFSICIGYNYTTSSKIFLNPNAVDVIDQNQYITIGSFANFSLEFRYRFSQSLIFGLDIETLENDKKGRHLNSPRFIVDDGFKIYPVEFSVYYFLPFSTEDFKFFMGGGFGIYPGERTRSFGDINFVKVDSEIGYGIQVSTGMDYILIQNISIRGEIRFRDPDFTSTNKYTKKIVTYDGNNYSVNTNNTISRINVDGITFRIGLAFQF